MFKIHFIVFITICGSSCFGLNQSQKDLLEFHRNTYRFMNSAEPKVKLGKRQQRTSPLRLSTDFVQAKFHFRNQLKKKQSANLFSENLLNNQLQNFFEGTPVRDDLNFILQENLRSAAVANAPWSADYWGTYRGGIAFRYLDAKAPADSDDYMKYRNYYKKHKVVDVNNKEQLDILSPAEKYDLLVGDQSKTLTESIYLEADETYTQNSKKIPSWFGICHGWAPASIMLQRPTKSIDLPARVSSNQTATLHFRPDDIKALASQLWATGDYRAKQLGGRCDKKNPKMDENGRIIDQECFDMNPAEWHLLVMNQIGLNRKSFVFDATWDQEVWNQPVHSYRITYFNVVTGEESNDPEKLLVPIEKFESDKFKKYRSEKTKNILGVRMQLKYVLETIPSATDSDSEENDSLTVATYSYDLEIDDSNRVIGGEWYRNVHPDFAWAPTNDSFATSFVDAYLQEEWKGFELVPEKWLGLIKQSSYYSRTPVARIVQKFLELSNK